ncbi:hypothetical protein AAH678_03090 [Sodalis endosymbiont of Spalangia cameroni]|uniref:hypothetical protein n=1 Tax=Sodalis praecaptivus TaxID=1239307 RepID=UPI0031F837A6
MNSIICSDSVRDMVLLDDTSSKLSATRELYRAEKDMLGGLSRENLIDDLSAADEEIMSIKGELAKWKALAEGQEWLLKEGYEFKRSIISIYEKGLKNKNPSTEILIDIIADTYASLGYQGDSHEQVL